MIDWLFCAKVVVCIFITSFRNKTKITSLQKNFSLQMLLIDEADFIVWEIFLIGFILNYEVNPFLFYYISFSDCHDQSDFRDLIKASYLEFSFIKVRDLCDSVKVSFRILIW